MPLTSPDERQNNADGESRIEQEALEFARAHKKVISKRLTDPSIYLANKDPVSVFMAGSPGAGKTEASMELLKKIGDPTVLRIDPDELAANFLPTLEPMHGCFKKPFQCSWTGSMIRP